VEEVRCEIPSHWNVVSGDETVLQYVTDDYPYVERLNIGACVPYTVICEEGEWRTVIEQVTPSAETCNGEDTDCNGEVDDVSYEGTDKCQTCVPDEYAWANYGPGTVCERGCRSCINGVEECVGFRGPEEEICDGLDNDCNGVRDDMGIISECGFTDVGECEIGFEICLGTETSCVLAVFPQPEVCDGLDNDCDGMTDEDAIQECATACGVGFRTCENGLYGTCNAPAPTPEICDGEDNDCNGAVDDGVTCSCIPGMIQNCPRAEDSCLGQQYCNEYGEWSECQGLYIASEESCNAIDDDCNGVIDEDLFEPCYDADPATLNIGTCTAGVTQCELGEWGPCVDQVVPGEEICNYEDDDCNGETDDIETIYTKVDMVFAIDISGSMQQHMDVVLESISNYISTIIGPEHQFAVVTFGDCQEFPGAGVYACPDEEYGYPVLASQLTDLATTVDYLNSFPYSGAGGIAEPSMDAVYRIADPINPLSIAWRDDATPIVIVIGDEISQTNLDIAGDPGADWRDDLAFRTILGEAVRVCELPGCNSVTNPDWTDGDPLELYVFNRTTYWFSWTREILVPDTIRIFDIEDIENMDVNIGLVFSFLCNLGD
jgi:hypothetical protein